MLALHFRNSQIAGQQQVWLHARESRLVQLQFVDVATLAEFADFGGSLLLRPEAASQLFGSMRAGVWRRPLSLQQMLGR